MNPLRDYGPAILLALCGWACLLWGYYFTGAIVSLRSIRLGGGLSLRDLGFVGFALLILAIGVDVLGGVVLEIPPAFRGALWLFRMLGWTGMILLVVVWARGYFRAPTKLAALIGIGYLVVAASVTATTASLARLAAVVLLALWLTKQRVSPWMITGTMVVVLALALHRGMVAEYRERVWFEEEGKALSERVGLLIETYRQSLFLGGPEGAFRQAGEVLSRRTSMVRHLADVYRQTPERVPYWGGATYYSLVGAFVPRFLWPGKPTKELGQAFGHRYGYLTPHDTHTSVNLPYLVEFYANFGVLGVVLGMALVGMLYRFLDDKLNRPGQPLLVSAIALSLFVSLLNIESDFSLVFGGLILNGVALFVVAKWAVWISGQRRRSELPAA
jgi:hypothetical protein